VADVFISYAREDAQAAQALADVLSARGWTVWWDRRMVPGKSFDEVIERELESASAVIVLWSSHSVESRWVRDEAAIAADRKILVPALIEPELELPLGLRSMHSADLSGIERGDARDLSNLLTAVKLLVPPYSPPERSVTDERIRKSDRWKRRVVWPWGAVVAALALGTLVLTQEWAPWRWTDGSDRPATAVLPFVDDGLDGDPGARFGQGIQQWVTGALTEGSRWNMVTLTLSEELDLERTLLGADVSTAEEVRRLVGGRYLLLGDSVFVEAVVVDVNTGKVVSTNSIMTSVRDIRPGVASLAENLALGARSTSSRSPALRGSVSLSALAAYVQGIVQLNNGRPGAAHEWFSASSRSDYGPAEIAMEVVAPFDELGPPKVAVFPFLNAGTQLSDTLTAEQLEPLRRGFMSMLLTDISRGELVVLLERSRLDLILEELNLAKAELADASEAARVGRLLGADIAVLGTFAVLGADLLVQVQLIDVRSGLVIRSIDDQRPFAQLFAMPGAIAQQINETRFPSRADDSSVAELIAFLEAVNLGNEAARWQGQIGGARSN
jgi:TolB-like protein